MTKLKLAGVEDDTPVKLTIELPATVHRDLVAYGEAIGKDAGRKVDPAKLVAPMLSRFMGTDRAFAKLKKSPGSAKM